MEHAESEEAVRLVVGATLCEIDDEWAVHR